MSAHNCQKVHLLTNVAIGRENKNDVPNMNCTVIAEAPSYFPWGFDEEDERCVKLKLLILSRLSHLQAKGETRCFIPIDAGFGLYAAELAASLTVAGEGPQLFCLIPCEEQAVKWSPELRNRYYAVLEKCTEPISVSVERTPTCELDAMLEAIDRADLVIAVGAREQAQDRNYAAALRYAERIGRDIQSLVPPKLE